MTKIYVASKTKHANIWLYLREQGFPIISTWIDESGPGQTLDWDDLWYRCLSETASSDVFMIYRDVLDRSYLKGAFMELGVAIHTNCKILSVGMEDYTIGQTSYMNHFDDLESMFIEAKNLINEGFTKG